MKKRKLIIPITLTTILSLSGCAEMSDFHSEIQEKTAGTTFTANVYDSYGNNTLTVSGEKMSLDVMKATSGIFASETDTKYASSVLDVTIDGHQMLLVGDTVIFAEEGLNMITDFKNPENIDSTTGGSGWQMLDRNINKYKNSIGEAKTIIVSSQLGVPIGVFEGDKVHVKVLENLPKTTRLNIDGKSLYIHRGVYEILDSALIQEGN